MLSLPGVSTVVIGCGPQEVEETSDARTFQPFAELARAIEERTRRAQHILTPTNRGVMHETSKRRLISRAGIGERSERSSATRPFVRCYFRQLGRNYARRVAANTTGTVHIGCTDCHGGNAETTLPAGVLLGSQQYLEVTKQAHPRPRFAESARSSANPIRAYTKWLKEDADYIKFVNPGDLRVAKQTCGRSGCHTSEVQHVRTSMMTHGAMLWEAALYNNGAIPLKNAFFGESYASDGTPQRLQTFPPPTPEETRIKGNSSVP